MRVDEGGLWARWVVRVVGGRVKAGCCEADGKTMGGVETDVMAGDGVDADENHTKVER